MIVDHKYRTKIDLSIILFLSVILGGTLVKLLIENNWNASTILILQIAFIVHLFSSTFYTIKGNKLLIKSSFLVHTSFDISSIAKISETNNVMSAPAFSFDRLKILDNKNNSVMISPKDKKGFIDAIKKINPEVEIVLKK
ncbi:hypothetical protein HNP37_003085 [Flavobacterium nitrogenifigens]|uniref:Uncharacterized protein YyaB-like PH domain-containing protein n=2 Tax=Flavobacterium TaxID=237 RepID=A0A7W7IZX3_9FLAO|nr:MULTISPECIES: PH domain-containing protein [Flavobacterium]MBB4803010.1 hypothetical protein [Flavobacterium nitrogenifigens]MBB6387968.1 hypothetical protein [Flavobacterium notoginsengisoli]